MDRICVGAVRVGDIINTVGADSFGGFCRKHFQERAHHLFLELFLTSDGKQLSAKSVIVDVRHYPQYGMLKTRFFDRCRHLSGKLFIGERANITVFLRGLILIHI
ncbi:MAG: hypothetical protein ACI309_06350 [Candidatus Limisoma sp.]